MTNAGEYLTLFRYILPLLLKQREDPALLTNLAKAYFDNGDITQAKDLYDYIGPTLAQRHSSNHPMVLSYQLTSARIKLKFNEIEAGKQLFHVVIAKTESLHGNTENHQLSAIYRNYADGLLHDCQEYSQAIEYYLRALQIREKLYGTKSHANLKNLYLGLIAAYQKLDKTDKVYEYQALLSSIDDDATNKNDKREIESAFERIKTIINQCGFIAIGDNEVSRGAFKRR